MSKIYTMCGLPGSGKSTYAKNYLPDCVIVSSDAIRGELYGSEEIQGNAKKVFAEAFRRIREAVNNGQDVVFDATNLNREKRMEFIQQFVDCEHICVYLKTSLRKCLEQNANRDRQVPTIAIHGMARRLQEPQENEGFSKIILVQTIDKSI